MNKVKPYIYYFYFGIYLTYICVIVINICLGYLPELIYTGVYQDFRGEFLLIDGGNNFNNPDPNQGPGPSNNGPDNHHGGRDPI